ncbi:MAG: RING finger domain-containing protein, partial [Candidatus Babeliales bacterium]|nr:RING finger domain-containing protein [Candidatus Babeliales bacterium]
MRNKIVIILCLMGWVPLFAAAPAPKTESDQSDMREELRAAGLARVQRSREGQASTAAQSEPAVVQPPEEKEREQKQQEQEEEETCAICIDALYVEGKPTKTLHCRSRNPQAREHTFHTACIDPWLARDPRCPVCRTAVPQNEIPQ